MANTDVTRIASNIGALNALNSLQNINKQLSIHQTRLSTGKRINSSADDPAGYTIATKMLARSEGLKVALSNIGDAGNMLSVAEAGLSKMNDIVLQMRSKAEQAASDTLGSTEREAIATQLSAYAEQIDNIVNETKWNGVKLLDGTVNKQFQTGVDQGEVTTWALATQHDATSLHLSTAVAADQVTGQVYNASVSSITNGATLFTGLTKAATGSYKVAVGDVATSDTVGYLATSGTVAGITLSAVAVTDKSGGAVGNKGLAAEIANGTSTFEITAYNTTSKSLSFKVGGTAYTRTLGTGTGITTDLGGGLAITNALADTAVMATGTLATDYVQADHAKYSLLRADGSAVAVDNNTTNDTVNTTSNYFYMATSEVYDTGIGISVTAGTDQANTYAARNAGVSTFSFAQKNNYSVDVSTAGLASSYMTTANTAIDTVNRSMASLGSLMARLTFKEDQIATAQVNVESSYSRIMNANMAEEQVNASKFTILQQTATAMLAQANQAPQSLLSLFR